MVLLSSLAGADETPEPPREHSPYQLRVDVDVSLLVLGAVLWGGTSFISGGSVAPPWCGTMSTPPCNPHSLNALNRLAVGLDDSRARLAANIVAGVVPGAFALLVVADAGVKNWRGWLIDAAVIAEATLWTGAVQDIVRRAVRRPRPFMYVPERIRRSAKAPRRRFRSSAGTRRTRSRW